MDDFYLLVITALLPLTAVLLVLQVNPYQALVMRGILGAIAALVYALFGAADVALTEALVGTMLSITLYAVAVRSSMEMRLGWVHADSSGNGNVEVTQVNPQQTIDEILNTALRQALKPHHLRLETVAYPTVEALEIALNTKHIHSAVWPRDTGVNGLGENGLGKNGASQPQSSYPIQTRIKRLHEILSDRLPPELATVDYVDLAQPYPSKATLPLAQSPHQESPSIQESPSMQESP